MKGKVIEFPVQEEGPEIIKAQKDLENFLATLQISRNQYKEIDRRFMALAEAIGLECSNFAYELGLKTGLETGIAAQHYSDQSGTNREPSEKQI